MVTPPFVAGTKGQHLQGCNQLQSCRFESLHVISMEASGTSLAGLQQVYSCRVPVLLACWQPGT